MAAPKSKPAPKRPGLDKGGAKNAGKKNAVRANELGYVRSLGIEPTAYRSRAAGTSTRLYPGESPKSQIRPGLDKMSPTGTTTTSDGVYGIRRPARTTQKDGSIKTQYKFDRPGMGAESANAGRAYGVTKQKQMDQFGKPYTGSSTDRNWRTGKKTSTTRRGGK